MNRNEWNPAQILRLQQDFPAQKFAVVKRHSIVEVHQDTL